MALGDITAGLLEICWRLVEDVIVDFLFGVLVQRVGYFIAANILRMRRPDPDGIAVIVIGFTFWASIGFALYSLLTPAG